MILVKYFLQNLQRIFISSCLAFMRIQVSKGNQVFKITFNLMILTINFFKKYHYFSLTELFFSFIKGYPFIKLCFLPTFTNYQCLNQTRFFHNEQRFLFLLPIFLSFIYVLTLEEFSIFLKILFLLTTFLSILTLIFFFVILTISNH